MPEETVFNITLPPTHCSQCGAEYRNIQHPMKPLGVTIMRVCECVASTTTQQDAHGNSISVTTLTPPKRT